MLNNLDLVCGQADKNHMYSMHEIKSDEEHRKQREQKEENKMNWHLVHNHRLKKITLPEFKDNLNNVDEDIKYGRQSRLYIIYI